MQITHIQFRGKVMVERLILEKEIEYPKITIRAHTLDEEVNYTWTRIKRIDFFNRFGYNLSLPETETMKLIINKSMEKELEDRGFEALMEELSKVYKIDFYQNGINSIRDSVSIAKDSFKVFEKYVQKWGFKLYGEYIIKLTRFGPGGSYDSDCGHVIIKTVRDGIASKRKNPAEIVVHEIIHIGIEDVIIKRYNIPHEVKERIVDKFISYHFKELFPDYIMWNKGDTRIDKYIEHDDSWDRLPYYIEKFVNENL